LLDALRGWWGGLVVILAFVCLVATGMKGLDFGNHWDEDTQLRLVNQTIASRSFLPGLYNYPAVTYWLGVSSVFPDVVSRFGTETSLDPHHFYLRARAVFLVVSSLGGFWVYLALRTRAGELGAAFGGATYLLSFQLAYHARWIAPDGVTASMTALFILWFVRAWDEPEARMYRYLPAVAAALAAASKYQGAVVLVPLLIMYVARWRRDPPSFSSQVRDGLVSLAVFAATWLLVNPGAVFQARRFRADVLNINDYYRSGHISFQGAAPSYDIHDPPVYLWRLARYVVVSMPSHTPAVSLVVFALACVGLATLARRDRWFAAAMLAPCLILPLYFATLPVFVVRNFLLLLPFLAYFAGVGLGRLRQSVKGTAPIAALGAAAALILMLNGVWLVRAADTVAQGNDQTLADAAEYMRDRPDKQFVVSRAFVEALEDSAEDVPDNARTGQVDDAVDEVLVLYSELRDNPDVKLRRWPSTERGTFQTIGPNEVDFDFYSTWDGDDRVLVFDPDQLEDLGLEDVGLDPH
jgi:hypothetical protein